MEKRQVKKQLNFMKKIISHLHILIMKLLEKSKNL